MQDRATPRRPAARRSPCVQHVQPLEPRRMMSFTAIGRPTAVPAAGNASSYDLAVAGDGTYYVASNATVRSPSLNRDVNVLTVTRYGATGRAIGEPITVSRYVAPGSFASIDADADGDAVVVFCERRGTTNTLSYQRITNGLPFSAAQRFYEEPEASNPRRMNGGVVSMSNNGRFYVAYRGYFSDNTDSGDGLQVRAFPEANPFGTLIQALRPTASTFNTIRSFDLAARPDGQGAVFAANVVGAGGVTDGTVFGRLTNTAKAGTDGTIGGLDGGAVLPSVTVAANNAFVIGYGAAGPTNANVYARRYDPAGAQQGAAIDVSGDGVDISATAISIDAAPDGGFVAGYSLNDTDAAGASTVTVTARRFDASGNADESGPVAALTAPAFRSTQSIVGVDSAGNAVVGYGPSRNTMRRASPVAFRRLTPGVIVDGTELYVVGTGGGDRVEIFQRDGRVNVIRNNVTRTFRPTAVRAISAIGLGGDDRIDNSLQTVPATLSGGDGNDLLYGGNGRDRIFGDAGNDTLQGNGGNDTVNAGDGNDVVYGGEDDDAVFGDAGDDILRGDNGNDSVDGGAGSDFLRGVSGNDTLTGGSGSRDRLYGDAGDDVLNGGGGTDRLYGGLGTDAARDDGRDILDGIETIARR